MATALLTDTYKAIMLLQKKSFSEPQAEGIVEVVKQIDISYLATKDDVKDLKQELTEEMHKLKIDLIKWVVGTQLAYGAIVISILVALR